MKTDFFSCLNTFIRLVLPLLFASGCTPTELSLSSNDAGPSCITRGWPHDNSDLQPDPAVIFGTLDNGFRYVIMHNDEPRDRVGLYLNIQAGSLNEADSQRGYAHFLEHMLFNGTKNYPPGTLVEYFQSIGMDFGSDTNAHTNFDETVYRLLLPDGSEKNLADGLQVMGDYARRALLLEEEVERERGVILAEKRSRDSVGYRLYEKRMKFLYAGTRLAERFPIGVEDTLAKANASSLRSFYDAWYRPENMIMVVVGDVDAGIAQRMIESELGPLTAPSRQIECYDFGRVEKDGDSFLYAYEPETGATEINIGASREIAPKKDSVANQREEMEKYVASMLFQNRLKQLVNRPDSLLTKAYVYNGNFAGRLEYALLAANVEGRNWQQGLDLLNTSLRQAVELGFSDRELNRVKKEILAELDKDVQTRDSRDSRKLADDIIHTLNVGEVFLSPEQALRLYGPFVENLTLSRANEVFRQMWDHGNRQVLVAGTAEIQSENNPEEAIADVYAASRHKEIVPWREEVDAGFPYLAAPQAQAAFEHQRFDAVGVDRYVFGNGTVLNVKQTSFQPNQVLADIHFGGGRSVEEIPGLALLAGSVVNASGTGRMTRNELEESLAGSNVNVSFSVDEESFALKGSSLSGELELMLQLMYARLLDPAFREEALALSMERFAEMYEQMGSSVSGIMQMQGEKFLAGGNPFYGMPLREEFERLTLDQVREWLVPVFASAPLEVSVAGDVDPAAVAGLADRYFGSAERRGAQQGSPRAVAFPAGKSMRQDVATQVDKALVVVAWPTDDYWDIARTRRLNILSRVLDDRIRLEIRERIGAAYSPQVWNSSSRVQPGYGVLRVMLVVDPGQAGMLAEKVREVAAGLIREGVAREELARSLEPTLTSIKDMVETNNYWMSSVLTLSSRHPEQLEWPLTIREGFAGITVEDVNEFAARYLKPEASAEIIIIPETVRKAED